MSLILECILHPTKLRRIRRQKNKERLWKEFDWNNIPGNERIAIRYAHGIALEVFRWIRTWCIVKNPDGEIIDDLPSKYIVNLLDALLAYKLKALSWWFDGAPHCMLWMLKAQVLNVVEVDPSFEKLWKSRTNQLSHSLTLTLDAGCTVEWKDNRPTAIKQHSKLFS
jgi:hypothetical protein